MLSDIVALFLAIVGVVFILFSVIFKLLIWRENEAVVLSIPLKSDDKEIYDRIINLREICSFLGIQKQCTIAIINYGASDLFINRLKKQFSEYDFIKIINPEALIKELHT